MSYRTRIGIFKKEEFEKFKNQKYDNLRPSQLTEVDGFKELYEIGNLITIMTNAIDQVIASTTVCPNFGPEDDVWLIDDQTDFFLRLSEAYWKSYIFYLKTTSDEMVGFDEKRNYGIGLAQKLEDIYTKYNNIFNNQNNDWRLIKSDMYNFMTINFLYLHKSFDYENNVIVIYSW